MAGLLVSPKPLKKFQRSNKFKEEFLEQLCDQIDGKHARLMKIFHEQSTETRDAISRMADSIQRMMPKKIQVTNTSTGDKAIVDIPAEFHEKVAQVMAVEAIRDLALMDIQVQDFFFTAHCAECSKPLKKVK